jgi:Restriction endonuclease S subunits
MEYKRLKDIANITMGQSPDSSSYNNEKDGLPFFQGNADFGELYPKERFWCNAPKKVAMPGDILISVRAPIGALNYSKGKSCIGRGLAAITIENIVERNYIFHLLKARNNYLNSMGTGSTFKAIGKNVLEEILIPQISREEQQKCVNMMDLLGSIIRERQSQLGKFDDIIKARFVEMFGDPKINSQNRPEIELINVVTMQRGFDLPVNERKENGEIPVYGSNGILGYHNIAKVHGGGIITGRSGTIGKVQYIKGDYWPLNTTLFSTKTHNNNIVFLAYLIELFDLSRFVEGTGVPTLNRNKFHNKKIINIPKREQKQFADFVQQVSKSKIVLQRLRSFTMIMTWE